MHSRCAVRLMGIAGGSCSGKGTLCGHLQERLPPGCLILPMDAYYRDLSHLPQHERHTCNFDVPDALDHDLLAEHLGMLAAGRTIDLPVYDFTTHTRLADTYSVRAVTGLIVVEGLFSLYWKEIRELLSLKVFIDLEWETCLERRIERDVRERGRTRESIEQQFYQSVLPMYNTYVAPTRCHADLILHGGAPVRELGDMVIRAASAKGLV